MEWTIAGLLAWAANYFAEKGIATPRLDAELLLAKVLKVGRVQLYTQFDKPLTEAELATFKVLVKRRAEREPLAYIVGEREFFSLPFLVNASVLVPRPETEELVERALHFFKGRAEAPLLALDLATGSGCILVSLLHHWKNASGMGVDISGGALEVAERNADRHGVATRATWLQQDLSTVWPSALEGPFDLISANLPYVSEEEWRELEPELKNYEPKQALVPGVKGWEAFEWVLPQVETRLQAEGVALFEIGMTQELLLLQKAKQYCPRMAAKVHPDLSGKPRILELKFS